MTQILLLLALAAIVVTACAETGGESNNPPPSSSAGEDSFTIPSGGTKPSLAQGFGSVTGVLTFDDIEGGCSYLESADGTRYEVLYPDGWTLDRAASQLRGPDGQRAGAGATIRVDGAIATDRSSICQVGPIFRASAVAIGPD